MQDEGNEFRLPVYAPATVTFASGWMVGLIVAMKDAGLRAPQLRSGNWLAPPGGNRSGA
jgi:hypothetical protein